MSAKVEKEFCGRKFYVLEESSAIVDDAEPMLARLEGVRPGDVFVDVGAGHGTYALRAAAMGANVAAFEPHPPTREALRWNAVLNEHPTVFNVSGFALWDGSPYPIGLASAVWGAGGHYPVPPGGEVRFSTLDAEFEGARVDWVKLDVEGAELGVLRGARETLLRWRPTLLVEDHDGVNPDPGCVVSRYAEKVDSSRQIAVMLGSLGYHIDVLPWGCGRRFLVAEHPRRHSREL